MVCDALCAVSMFLPSSKLGGNSTISEDAPELENLSLSDSLEVPEPSSSASVYIFVAAITAAR